MWLLDFFKKKKVDNVNTREEFYKQITLLFKLKPGWYNGEGKEIDRIVLERLVYLFECSYINDIYPRVYPMKSGGVHLEIDKINNKVEIDIERRNSSIIANMKIFESKSEIECEFDLNNNIDWFELLSMINL